MRPSSGVTPVTIFTQPYACGGNCLFCPTVPEIPKSYLPHSDVRKKGLSHDAAGQMRHWLSFIESRGGIARKIEVVVLGGSFTAHPPEYQREFLRGIYRGVDGGEDAGDLEACVERHAAGSGRRIIGITVETRPDLVTRESIEALFAAGVTKIELGVQSLDDDVLAFNERGHGAAETARATALIRGFGLKVGYHVMLGLPGSSTDTDLRTMASVLHDPLHCPDHLKIYFCEMFRREFMRDRLVILYDSGQWSPLSLEQRRTLLRNILPKIPGFMRVSRIGRQTKEEEIEGMRVRTANVEEEFGCRCIRCREPRPTDPLTEGFTIRETIVTENELFLEARPRSDDASGSWRDDACLGVLRLHHENGIATVRELHVYGEESPPGKAGRHQHRGVGRALMAHVEFRSRAHGIGLMKVCCGVGVRSYFEKLGFAIGRGGFACRKVEPKCTEERTP